MTSYKNGGMAAISNLIAEKLTLYLLYWIYPTYRHTRAKYKNLDR